MKKLLAISALSLAIVLAAGAFQGSSAFAAANQKLDLVCDSCDDSLDMLGPVTGFVNYNQNANGDLRLEIKLNKSAANTEFTIYLVCGPTHDESCGFDDFGTVTTNGQGNASTGAIVIPKCTALAILSADPDSVGHVDLLDESGIALAATAVNFDASLGASCD